MNTNTNTTSSGVLRRPDVGGAEGLRRTDRPTPEGSEEVPKTQRHQAGEDRQLDRAARRRAAPGRSSRRRHPRRRSSSPPDGRSIWWSGSGPAALRWGRLLWPGSDGQPAPHASRTLVLVAGGSGVSTPEAPRVPQSRRPPAQVPSCLGVLGSLSTISSHISGVRRAGSATPYPSSEKGSTTTLQSPGMLGGEPSRMAPSRGHRVDRPALSTCDACGSVPKPTRASRPRPDGQPVTAGAFAPSDLGLPLTSSTRCRVSSCRT